MQHLQQRTHRSIPRNGITNRHNRAIAIIPIFIRGETTTTVGLGASFVLGVVETIFVRLPSFDLGVGDGVACYGEDAAFDKQVFAFAFRGDGLAEWDCEGRLGG